METSERWHTLPCRALLVSILARNTISNASAMRALTDGRMDRHTHTQDKFYTLDRRRGREVGLK